MISTAATIQVMQIRYVLIYSPVILIILYYFLSLSLSFTLSFSVSLPLFFSPSHFLSLTFSHFLSLSLSLSLSLFLLYYLVISFLVLLLKSCYRVGTNIPMVRYKKWSMKISMLLSIFLFNHLSFFSFFFSHLTFLGAYRLLLPGLHQRGNTFPAVHLNVQQRYHQFG